MKAFKFQIGDNLVTYGGEEEVVVLGVKSNLKEALTSTEDFKAVELLQRDLDENCISKEDEDKPFYLIQSDSFPGNKYYVESELEINKGSF
jgi:hypothetical protein